jgi:hypothetical protein
MRDPLFEYGYFALSDELAVLWRPTVVSATIRTNAKACTGPFQSPLRHAPALVYLQEHQDRTGQ